MSEYIEREAAIEMIKNDLPEQARYYRQDAIECLEYMPTADVVPKSEVDRLKVEGGILEQECGKLQATVASLEIELEAMRSAANSYKMHYEKALGDIEVWKQNRFNLYQRLECYEMARQKVAREIFEEIEKLCDAHLYWNNCSIIQRDDIAELKKKYIPQNAEKCIVCGDVIPEGRQVCPKCERSVEK